MLNADVRLVLRQLRTRLAEKIEQNLPNCAVLSLAAYSAASYAGAALDPTCIFALRFPEDGALVGFMQSTAEELDVAGFTVYEAERRIGRRILAVGTATERSHSALIYRSDTVVTFGPVAEHRVPAEETDAPNRPRQSPRSMFLGMNPILRTIVIAAICFFSFSFFYFHNVLCKTWLAACFYVVETMTNVGFGEVNVTKRGPVVTLGALVAMLGGITFTSIFIGYVSSALTRAEFTLTQGLRRVRARGHIVVCGGGSVPAATLAVLTGAGKRAVVHRSRTGCRTRQTRARAQRRSAHGRSGQRRCAGLMRHSKRDGGPGTHGKRRRKSRDCARCACPLCDDSARGPDGGRRVRARDAKPFRNLHLLRRSTWRADLRDARALARNARSRALRRGRLRNRRTSQRCRALALPRSAVRPAARVARQKTRHDSCFSNVKPFDTLLYLEPLTQAYDAVEAQEHETITVQGT